MTVYSDLYIIHTKSPLHVGSGDSNYGIIDKVVQRDPLDNYPIIHSSSLKGALREFYSHRWGTLQNDQLMKKRIYGIFGSEADSMLTEAGNRERREKSEKGSFGFDFGYLLSLPVRCDQTAFLPVSCPHLIRQFYEQLDLFEVEIPGLNENLQQLIAVADQVEAGSPWVFDQNLDGFLLEEFDLMTKKHEYQLPEQLKNIFGEHLAIMDNANFAYLAEKLPVIPRNKLVNGESKNLWYEEIVPRESRFFTLISKSKAEDKEGNADTSLINSFDAILEGEKKVRVQIGANATIGFGQVLFHPIKTEKDA